MSDTSKVKEINAVEEENEKATFKLREKSWWDDKHVVLDIFGEVLEVL